jgi:sulfate adenylyltransferase
MPLNWNLSKENHQDLLNLGVGLFAPLKGFMVEADYRATLSEMSLADGSLWTLPITLDVDETAFVAAKSGEELALLFSGKTAGYLRVADRYEIDPEADLPLIFQTSDPAHPRIEKERARHRFRLGGEVRLAEGYLPSDWLTPENTRAHFSARGWKTVAGFQTRNPVHRAHEHLQRTALDICDGLFINPLLDWKKPGDFTEDAVTSAYGAMLRGFYPKEKVYYAGLRTPMRYAGPREAVFHALIRKNLGCTHFIVGRDHAGAGGFYGKYEAQDLAKKLCAEGRLDIRILAISEPYHCKACGHVVTEAHCAHGEDHKTEISATIIRRMLSDGGRPPQELMRPEIADAILAVLGPKFITEDAS